MRDFITVVLGILAIVAGFSAIFLLFQGEIMDAIGFGCMSYVCYDY